MASASPVDFPALIGPVARRLLGEPNARLSGGRTLRWGSHGSLKVDLDPGCYHDKEANEGGGTLDLIMRERRCDKRGAIEWLESEGLKEREAARGAGPVIRSAGRVFYDYADEQGVVLFRVERRGKDAVPPFLQHGPDGNGGFHAARGCMQGVRRVPYRLPELIAAPAGAIVFVCEGEKDADNLAALGYVATTNPGGAGKFTADMAKPLAGRTVVVLQDNDKPGADHVTSVLTVLDGVAARAVPLLLPNLPEKGDITDWLKLRGKDASVELERLAYEALTVAPAPAETFPIADLATWANTEPEPKRFVMAGFIPEHEVTLFTGSGGTNKSTLGLQLCACSAAGLPLFGVPVQPGPALYVTAEDDDRENHWRLRKIASAIGTPLDRLAGRLHVVSLRGHLNNELATFDGEGRLHVAPAYKLLRATIEATGSMLLVLDNVGHLYVGNENDRGQVTGFINLLYQLCRELGVTVVLIGHPNKQFLQGNTQGNATSGSTAWLNAVRSQLLIQRPEGLDPDARILSLGKANYARPDQQIAFRWHDFALVRDEDLSPERREAMATTIAHAHDNGVFLDCLAERTRQLRPVSERSGRNLAPVVFAAMPEGKGLTKARLEAAMDRLFRTGAIERGFLWRDTAEGRDIHGLRVTANGTKISANASANDPQTRSANDREQSPQTTANTHPYTTYNTGAAQRAAAPVPDDWNANPALGRTGAGCDPIFAPGETGDEPIPGWDA